MMTKSENPSINNELYKLIIRTFPPKKSSPLLEEIIDLLMNSLYNGDLKVNIETNAIIESLDSCTITSQHKEALIASGWVEGENSPIVLEGDEISWRRWTEEINGITNELIRRLNNNSSEKISLLNKEENNEINKLNKMQLLAISLIKEKNILLLSGGPGTGKTSTVMWMLDMLYKDNPKLKVGLAAPTAKAAGRLKETIQKGINKITTNNKQVLSEIPSATIHRWLEASPNGFKRNIKNQINIDLMVIDEMSMVELELMKALLKAIPEGSKLVLVGDKDQLSPVGGGSIWEELQRIKYSKAFSPCQVNLTETYRNRGDIANLSKVILQRGVDQFWLELSKKDETSNLIKHESSTQKIPQLIIEKIKSHYNKISNLSNPISKEILINNYNDKSNNSLNFLIDDLFIYLENIMFLSPARKGRWSVEALNKIILGERANKDCLYWPQGTPIISRMNQPEIEVYNGDIGVILGQEKEQNIIFRTSSNKSETGYKLINPARLKRIEAAFSLTIHKAQGSEAKEVNLLWPYDQGELKAMKNRTKDGETYEQKLLYTAVTRAKDRLDIFVPIKKEQIIL